MKNKDKRKCSARVSSVEGDSDLDSSCMVLNAKYGQSENILDEIDTSIEKENLQNRVNFGMIFRIIFLCVCDLENIFFFF